MEWIVIVGQIVGALMPLVAKAIAAGSLTSLLDTPLKDLLPHELRTTIAKREADDAAARKFGVQP